MFIGTGFLGTGFLDAYHTFVTSEHFSIFFPSPPESLIPWSWIASRLFLSVFMFFAYYDWYKHYKYSRSPKQIYMIATFTTLIFFLFFILLPLPQAYYENYFFHRPEEWLPALFFALALYGFYTKGGWKKSDIEYWIVLSLIVNIITQSVFMSFSAELFDYEFDMAHLLKKVSYIAVLTGIYINMKRSFQNESLVVKQMIQARKELESDKQRYKALMNSSSDGIFIMDMDGNLKECSQMAADMLGYSMQEMTKLNVYDWDAMIPADEIPNLFRSTPVGKSLHFPSKHKRKDGSIYDADISSIKIIIAGEPVIYASTRDITDLKKKTEIIEKQRAEFKTIFDISRDGIAILDLQSNFLDFNDAYLSMTGFSREELLLTSCIALSIPEDVERAMKAMQIVMQIGYLESFEKTCVVKDGKQVVIMMALYLMPDKKRILISTTDITEMKDHEQQLKSIANYDPLTNLPNRILFSDRIKQNITNSHRNNQKLAIAYLDLDGFKQVNDTYGHDAGDFLLIEVSKRMQKALREGDTLARFGGDEFVVILANQNDEDEGFAVLNRLLEAASSPIDMQNTVITVSASIGVTFYSKENAVDADILLRQADQAMYKAKLRGKNQIVVFDEVSP